MSQVYLLTLNLNSADSHIEALVGCICQGTCTDPLECSCQGEAVTGFIGMENGAAKFAYKNVSPPKLEVYVLLDFVGVVHVQVGEAAAGCRVQLCEPKCIRDVHGLPTT